ncbi:MAG: hypothetical protein ACK42D_00515 [Candidatus Paceibacteria bacterium]
MKKFLFNPIMFVFAVLMAITFFALLAGLAAVPASTVAFWPSLVSLALVVALVLIVSHLSEVRPDVPLPKPLSRRTNRSTLARKRDMNDQDYGRPGGQRRSGDVSIAWAKIVLALTPRPQSERLT